MEPTVAEISPSLREVVKELFNIGVIRLGSFKLRSGLISPIYIDLRVIVSYPKLLKAISQMMWEHIQQEDTTFDLICGVPYTALPFATCMAVKHNIPLIIRRKEGPKGYGTKKALEGVYSEGQNCLVIEDLITTGGSLLEIVKALRAEGLVVKHVAVFLDREQGGRREVEKENLQLHSILQISQLLQILSEENIVDSVQLDLIKKFIEHNQLDAQPKEMEQFPMTFTQRADLAHCKLAGTLLRLMDNKKTNLAVAVDVSTKRELLHVADTLGPEICLLKTHMDIINDFDQDLVKQLQNLAERHNFLIFEDRKFADIGNTVKLQYQNGMFHISDWAHIVTVHSLPGSGIIEALKSVENQDNRGILLLAQMSSTGALTTAQYSMETLKMAAEHKDFVLGFIARGKLADYPGFLHVTPGVNLEAKFDSLGQQYLSVEQAIHNGSDIIVVGRGILQDQQQMKEKAQQYRKVAWEAYLARLARDQ